MVQDSSNPSCQNLAQSKPRKPGLSKDWVWVMAGSSSLYILGPRL